MTLPLRLEGDALTRLLPLIPAPQDAGHMTFVHAVIEGKQRGAAYVDPGGRPRSALFATFSGFYFALGEPSVELLEGSLRRLREEIVAEPPTVWAVDDAWAPILSSQLGAERQRFEFLPPQSEPPPLALPPGLRMESDLLVLARGYTRGLDEEWSLASMPWLLSIWGGAEGFAQQTFATGIFDGDRLVSLCGACAIASNSAPAEAEVEIWTAVSARGRGLATLAGGEFIRQCHVRGLEAAWTCEASNLPSRKLGERLGFRYMRTIRGYELGEAEK